MDKVDKTDKIDKRHIYRCCPNLRQRGYKDYDNSRTNGDNSKVTIGY